MRLSPLLKQKLADVLLPSVPPILCASIGRVASSIVQQALVRQQSNRRFGPLRAVPHGFAREPVWTLRGVRFRSGAIYVTHDVPYELVASPRLKIVFLYGRPSDTILSLVRRYRDRGPRWMDKHFEHMHARGAYNEMLHRDVLRLGERIEAWPAVRNANILGLRYATLWDNLGLLSDFVGFEVGLPARVERNFLDIDPAIVAMARKNYQELDLQESRLPDYFFTNSEKVPCRD